MSESPRSVPQAHVTLRAHPPAPARVELEYQPLPARLLRTLLSLLVLWGAIPLLIWLPPHYPWVVASFCAGLYLAHREWTGRYRVYSFAGICPRCGRAVSLGVDRAISLPHTLTCYHCHFEPRLEVSFEPSQAAPTGEVEHRSADCRGMWETRWLADEPYVICNECHAGAAATPEARAAADAENDRATMLKQLTREGKGLM